MAQRISYNNLTFFRGDDFRLNLTVIDHETLLPTNITGWKFFFTVKDNPNLPDTDAKIALTISDHSDATNGLTAISVGKTMTANLIGIYEYDIKFTTANNTTKTFMRGQIEFIQTVTRKYS